MSKAPDTAGVIALPPLIYMAALVVGTVLHFILPVHLPDSLPLRVGGGVLMLAAIVLASAARVAFARVGTEVNPMRPTTAITDAGPYRFTRNPMYVGLALLLVGIAFAFRLGWLLILAPVVLAIMHWGVVLREERYLSRKFGAPYDAYRARVRRYL
jgi:protein-S-isoprenylcysteine O-methyltransferase Ste14